MPEPIDLTVARACLQRALSHLNSPFGPVASDALIDIAARVQKAHADLGAIIAPPPEE